MVESDVMKALKPFHLSLQDEILSLCARLEELKKKKGTKYQMGRKGATCTHQRPQSGGTRMSSGPHDSSSSGSSKVDQDER